MFDYNVRIMRDTIAPHGGRLISLCATYPRIVHAELMTHRAFARNAASSRAIPFEKMVEAVMKHPFIPLEWGLEQSGMQMGHSMPAGLIPQCEYTWLKARDSAVKAAQELNKLGLHKSLCNRLLEPFAWITTIITATEWANFFRLRCHKDAEVHLQEIAYMMRNAIQANTPELRAVGEWHVPYAEAEDSVGIHELSSSPEEAFERFLHVGVARCARVSYLTHEGHRDIVKDEVLFQRLVQGSGFGHWSPHEHVAQVHSDPKYASGPFRGFAQYRKTFANENVEGLGIWSKR